MNRLRHAAGGTLCIIIMSVNKSSLSHPTRVKNKTNIWLDLLDSTEAYSMASKQWNGEEKVWLVQYKVWQVKWKRDHDCSRVSC